MFPEVMKGRIYLNLLCCVFNCIKVLSIEAVVSFKFANVFSRNSGV